MIPIFNLVTILVFGLINIAGSNTTTTFDKDDNDDIVPVAWSVDYAHSEVLFKLRHLGISTVSGNFLNFEVDLQFDPENLNDFSVSSTIDVQSVDTGVKRRDDHLRSPDFFEVATFPQMRFVGTEVTNLSGNTFDLVGDLTIKDVTREVVLSVELLGVISARDGQHRAGFQARTKINRMDYGLQWNRLTETGGIVAGHEVTIEINLEAISNSPS